MSARKLTLLPAILLMGSVGIPGDATAHSEKEFGPALEPVKVSGVDRCQAVAVNGDRLYATGAGEFHVLDISEPSQP
ncbi:MAG: hypothetical protein KDN19_12170, partial [Verrucomicrobiae bacterium]|nr:hypothetical protein [Verrucomicrobiae bacterium]